MPQDDSIVALYDRIAALYHAKRQDPANSQWNDYLESPAMERSLRSLCPGRDILDLGCGTGILTAKLREWEARLVAAVDPSEEMLAIAREQVQCVEFRNAHAAALPYGDESFDIVASSLVLHYVKDPRGVFREVARVLRKGGYFVFSKHHPFEEILHKSPENPGEIRAGRYFHNDSYTWLMCGEIMTSYHHTLGQIINGLAAEGLYVCGVDECQPSPSVSDRFDAYEYTSQYPPFCIFKAQRIS